jgi:hypothetical protein
MSAIKLVIFLMAITAMISCKKDKVMHQDIPIPNGDFESWGDFNRLQNWITHYCPLCMTAINTYTVQKDSNVYHGKYAAKFIYNGAYPASAENKFQVSTHPVSLTGYVKSTLYGTDTVSIKIRLFKNTTAVDSGQWFGTSSIGNYTKIVIPITQTSMRVDSGDIMIRGGHKGNPGNNSTIFWVDYLTLQ